METNANTIVSEQALKAWWVFTKERFEPLSHLLMILPLFLANYFLAKGIVRENAEFTIGSVVAFVVLFALFYHMRLFDEIKDYETDCRVNPTRPLPRGLIALTTFKRVTFLLVFFELLVCMLRLPAPVAVGAFLMIGYTLLMYREFFVGSWLGPKMELYAITHTVVSGFMALYICALASGLFFWEMPMPFFLIALCNWMNFNIFEFARKTFAAAEERAGVESYSKRLTPFGAVVVVVLNAFVAVLCLCGICPFFKQGVILVAIGAWLSSLLLVTGLIYAFSNTIGTAKMYRSTATLYLVLFNALITGVLLF